MGIEKVRHVHVDVDCLETGAVGEKEELNHLWGVATHVTVGSVLIIITIFISVVVEGEPELGEGLEVFATRLQLAAVLDLEPDDPEEAEADAVGGDGEEVRGEDGADLEEEEQILP